MGGDNKYCFACEALEGAFGDSHEFIWNAIAENADLNSENPEIAATAWLTHLRKELPECFVEDFQAPTPDEIVDMSKPTPYYIVDVVMHLLHKAKHPLFAAPPAWLPPALLEAAKRLALAEAKWQGPKEEKKEIAMTRALIHDRLAPREEWRLLGNFVEPLTAIGATTEQLSVLQEQVLAPGETSPEDYPLLMAKLHSCSEKKAKFLDSSPAVLAPPAITTTAETILEPPPAPPATEAQ